MTGKLQNLSLAHRDIGRTTRPDTIIYERVQGGYTSRLSVMNRADILHVDFFFRCLHLSVVKGTMSGLPGLHGVSAHSPAAVASSPATGSVWATPTEV